MQPTSKDKFLALVSNETSNWLEKAKWRAANESWLKKSFEIALRVNSQLKAKKMTQRDLAEKMNVSPQQVSKIIQGKENLTLETITRLESALDVNLINVVKAVSIAKAISVADECAFNKPSYALGSNNHTTSGRISTTNNSLGLIKSAS